MVIKACELPLSIMIIGIGNAEFESMRILDGDYGLTSENGTKASRDIVQFVATKDFSSKRETFEAAVLAELPYQLVEYMNMVGKLPGKKS